MALSSARPAASPDRTTSARRVVLVGNYPPRRCGIATFTADLRRALLEAEPGADVRVVAMVDPGAAYDFPPEVMAAVPQDEPGAYREAARRINALRPDVVCVQHEYGIFGGRAGERLIALLDEVDAPVVATLHTVLRDPDADQRRVLQALARRSASTVVMAERGAEMLRTIYGVPGRRVMSIPHGVPDRPRRDTAACKRALGLGEGPLLFTFGLLSPNKGLDRMVEALPAVARAHRGVRYLVLGATHPHLLAREGEAYRHRLQARAEDLGVAEHLVFANRYADTDDLLDHLAAADVYVTPYLNEAQITSGTLSYAVALGLPVVSTPYWHAQELLGDGRGALVPFGDAGALAGEVDRLLSDRAARAEMSDRAYAFGRTMTWGRVADRYLQAFDRAVGGTNVVALRLSNRRPAPGLKGVRRLTDDCGMLQHGSYEVPDRNHGYCLDDNARALVLAVSLARQGCADAGLDRLASTYAAFVHHAWHEEAGGFRNFMSYDRRWLEQVGSQDSNGRALWALGEAAGDAPGLELKAWARGLIDRALPRLGALRSPRAQAFAILGGCALLEAQPGREEAIAMVRAYAEALGGRLRDASTSGWRWFEAVLAYDNARLPQALIRAAGVLDRPDLLRDGLEALGWLCTQQTAPSGCFRPVGSESFGRVREAPRPFDQQPLEAAATVDACLAAWRASGEEAWAREAAKAYGWFLDGNDLDTPLATPETGLCYDGLTPRGANLNQGAESVLAFQLASLAMSEADPAADALSVARPA